MLRNSALERAIVARMRREKVEGVEEDQVHVGKQKIRKSLRCTAEHGEVAGEGKGARRWRNRAKISGRGISAHKAQILRSIRA